MLGWMLLLACSSAPQQPAPPAAAAPSTWLDRVATTPDTFGALMESGDGTTTRRDAWLALTAGDARAALAQFQQVHDPLGSARAELDLGLLTADLDRLERHVVGRLAERLRDRPSDSSPALQQAVRLGTDCAATLASPAPEYASRAAAHGGDSLWTLGAEPFATTQAKDYTQRTWDPCVAHSLAAAHRPTADAAQEQLRAQAHDDPLAASLFAPWPSAALAGDPSPELLAAAPPAPADDLPQLALDHVHDFETRLQALQLALQDRPGAALVADAQLGPRLLQAWTTAQARAALQAGLPHRASVYADRAVNALSGPDAPPPPLHALVLRADAALSTGRTREALASLQQLQQRGPAVAVGLHELASDLAVLEGLGRQGDSRED